MEPEGAALGAPIEEELETAATPEVAAASATIVDPSLHPSVPLAPEASEPIDIVKEEEGVDFDPEEENNIVDSFLAFEGTVGEDPSNPVEGEGAAPSAPEETPSEVPADTAAESTEVQAGSSASAPSRPPRTRGTRGGKDSQKKHLRRAYYQSWDSIKRYVFEVTRPRPNRPGLTLAKIEFERVSLELQEFVLNWEYYQTHAASNQLLCELEYLIPQFAAHVAEHGFRGEGPTLAAHLRRQTPTIQSLYVDSDSDQKTYAQAWEDRVYSQRNVFTEPSRRVGAKSKAAEPPSSSGGAAPSAPDRASSVGSWVGRELLPPTKKNRGEGDTDQTSEQPPWRPSLRQASPVGPKQPDFPPPGWVQQLPKQPDYPPPGWNELSSPPTSNPPVSPPPSIRPVSSPRQPPVPPPAVRAPRPQSQPQHLTVSVRSLKTKKTCISTFFSHTGCFT